MKKILCFALLGFQLAGNTQVLENADALINTSTSFHSGGFAMDSWGNTYGSIKNGGVITFPSGSTNGSGTNHIFKHDANGQLLWSYSAGTNAFINNIQIDALDNVFITGYQQYGLIPDSLNPDYIYNFKDFVAKLNPDGSFAWITRVPGKAQISPMNNGHLAFAMYFGPTNGTGSPGHLGDELIQLGGQFFIFGELDSNGEVVWRTIVQQQISATNGLIPVVGCAYNNGKIYFYGYFKNTFNFGNVSLTLNQSCSGWTYPMSMFLAEVDIQSQQVENVIPIIKMGIRDIEFDSSGKIYLGLQHYKGSCSGDGLIQGQVIPEPNKNDAYIVRLNPNFSFDGIYDICGVSTSTSSKLTLGDMTMRNDNLYIIGYFNQDGSQMYLNPNGINYGSTNKIFVLRIDENLSFKYADVINSVDTSDPIVMNMQIDANDENVSIIAGAQSPTTTLIFQHQLFIGKYKCNSNSITGRAYKDLNSNGIYDAGDIPLSGTSVSTTPPALMSIIQPNGMFEIFVDSGQYTIELPHTPSYYTKQPATATISFNGNNLIDNADLTLIPVPGGNDVRVEFIEISPVVVGEIAKQKILITNDGTDFENGTVKLFPLNYSLPTPLPETSLTMYSGQGFLGYDFTNFAPGDTFSISVNYQIPLSFLEIIGETSPTYVEVDILNTDLTPQNNSASLTSQNFASYDPNYKAVNREKFIQIDSLQNFEYLSYTIHFQNDGNYHATNILVQDEISNLLDLTSLYVLDYSHEVRVEVVGRKIKFYFDNIMLPSSLVDHEGSQGYVHFKLKKNPNLIVGDSISNRAFIYFDYNPPIITEFVNNIIVDFLQVKSIENTSFLKAYPNPFKDKLTIEFKEIYTGDIYLTELSGRIIQHKSFSSKKQVELDLEMIESGLYILRFTSKNGESFTSVVVKQ